MAKTEIEHSNINFSRCSSEKELNEILQLQQDNLLTKVSDDEKEKEGFVTVEHTYDILKQMNDVCPHIIAKHDNKVVGYALCMHPTFADKIAVLQPMFLEIEKQLSQDESFIAMGQICVSKAHRKKGIFRKLYSEMKHHCQKDFKWIITEVDALNTRSMQAHTAVGFEEMCTYPSGNQDWKLIKLSTS